MSHNEFYSQVNVPFSWELKPGVSKVTIEDGGFDTVNLPPPPCLSKSARFCFDDLQGVLPPCQLQPPTRSSAKKAGNFNKQNDPFVAAYRKCTEYRTNGELGTADDENDACSKSRTRKNTLTLSCKYSCTVSSDNVVRLSRCSKEKAKENQIKKKKDRVMQN